MANDEKRIAKLAKKMAKLEKQLSYSNMEDRSDIEAEIEDFSLSLSCEDMIAVDDYITTHHLLN